MNEKRKANGDKCLWTSKNEQQHEQQEQVSEQQKQQQQQVVSQPGRFRSSENERERGRANALWQREEVKGESASKSNQSGRPSQAKPAATLGLSLRSVYVLAQTRLLGQRAWAVGWSALVAYNTPFSLAHALSVSLSVLSVRVRVCVSVNKMWLAKIQKKQTQRRQKNRKYSMKVC